MRILDFAHAASSVYEMADKVREGGGHLPPKWVDAILHRLKHEGPTRVLLHLTRVARRYPQIQEQVSSLQKRRELMDSPTYRALGWPIGSGSVESSHRWVVQARLKGAGMHWKPEHVNPMLAVRLALLNERWSEAWQEQHRLRQHLGRKMRQQQRFRERQAKHQEALAPPVPGAPTPKPTRQQTGRTQAQYRWGRQTFSPRRLKQAGGAKK